MTQPRHWLQFSGALFGLLIAPAASLPAGSAYAQTAPAAVQSKFEPLTTPALDPDALKPPQSTIDTSSKPPGLDATGKEPPSPKLPTSVNLGKYDLQFKAGQTSDVVPRTGLDSGETSNLSKMRPGKPESAVPDYFGLKLSAPTH